MPLRTAKRSSSASSYASRFLLFDFMLSLWFAILRAVEHAEDHNLVFIAKAKTARTKQNSANIVLCVPKIRFCNIGGEGYQKLGAT